MKGMKVYVAKRGNEYRVTTRKPVGSSKELNVPDSAAYLLLAAQATADALEDSLERMYRRNGDNVLKWGPGEGPDEDQARWEGEGGHE